MLAKKLDHSSMVTAYCGTDLVGEKVFSIVQNHRPPASIYDGHLHVALLCGEIFSKFLVDIRSTKVERKHYAKAFDLITTMAESYKNEAGRRVALHKVLQFDHRKFEVLKIGEVQGRETDGSILYDKHMGMIIEVKPERGINGDPLIEATEYIALRLLDDDCIRGACPTIVLCVDGAGIDVWGAVYLYGVLYMDPLCERLNLLILRDDMDAMCRVASLMYALEQVDIRLETYYRIDQHEIPTLCSRILSPFPEITSVDGYEWSYTDVLGSNPTTSRVFRANLLKKHGEDCVPPVSIVVKVSRRSYGTLAHSFMANLDGAPSLVHSFNVDPWWAIILMEFVEGTHPSSVSAAQLDAFERKLSLFHCGGVMDIAKVEIASSKKRKVDEGPPSGFVHGDIRRPNLIQRASDQAILLLDFDWAGVLGDARYPPFMNCDDEMWPGDNLDCQLITIEHDEEMFKKLIGRG